jgi:hypothetical protein
MRSYTLLNAALVAGVTGFSTNYAHAQTFVASLTGFNEIGGVGAGETGAVLSNGRGTLLLHLDSNARTADFTLTYFGLSSPVAVAHIHFGKVLIGRKCPSDTDAGCDGWRLRRACGRAYHQYRVRQRPHE